MKKIILLLTIALTSLTISAQSFNDQDRQLHFIAGMTFAGVAYEVNQDKGGENQLLWTVGTAAAVGLGKEFYDMRKGGSGFDVVDLSYTVAGGFASYLLGELGVRGGYIGLAGITGLFFRANF